MSAPAPATTARKGRRLAVARFTTLFGDLAGWQRACAAQRLRAPVAVRGFVAFAVVQARITVDAEYVVRSASKWGAHHGELDPLAAAAFRAEATGLGFCERESDKMWSKLAQIAVISGSTPAVITPDDYAQARQAFTDAVRERWGRLPKSAAPPLFGLDAVLFHRGQAHQPHPRRRSLATCTHEVDWNDVAARTPQLAETARRYLAQLHVSLRASSVAIVDTTLRQFAGLLAAEHPEITGFADVGREHIEHYKTWLTARPGCRRSQTLSKTTIGLRMGNLRIFFERIIEWDYDDAPGRNPVFAGDLRSRTGRYHASWTTRPPPRCSPQQRALPELFDRLAVELLARTGMRKGEFLGLRIDTVVQIGSAFWLRTPVGKMHTDRYVPLHPQLKTLLDDWLAERADWQSSDLLFTDRGHPIPPSRVDRAVRRAATSAGIGHVHPHQLRHTLATQAINRGMSLEAIAALLGHDSPQMTAHYARLHDGTVRRHWEAARKVDIAGQAIVLDPDGPLAEAAWAKRRLGRATQALPNGFCGLPVQKTCPHANACLTCPMFITTAEFLPQHREHQLQVLEIITAAEAPRPDPVGRDEPARGTQSRHHHHCSGERHRPAGLGSRCVLTTPPS